ncbi:MAG TPA: zinc ribbon domain-containing protein [Povalibacter sp.]|uniref:FmdB family zinc ribbon protein n=1 Tax=Povalibacter sp. TaxID=1962978 RepID=UPI002CDDF384|nr:zinc ribbon domain-containing protein [Povalibacter sp.]HMN46804.1 zinc ribbon domain-containing protein [Povalibacter sp.]
MPFYEYECSHCKFYVETLQKISDAPLKKCPSCGRQTLKKLISAPVFRLKGEGWYETDFKSDKENKRNLVGEDKEPETKADDARKPDSKTEAKTESKAESKPAAKKPAAKAKPVSKPKAKARPAKKKSKR